jgi:hypothetical protein
MSAILTHESESAERAESALVKWVSTKPDYVRYMDLAYYYEYEKQPEKAASAMLSATRYSLDDDTRDHGDFRPQLMGYLAAVRAYRSGQFKTVVLVCDQLEKGEEPDEEALTLQKAAARRALGQAATFKPNAEILAYDPLFYNESTGETLGTGDINYRVLDPRSFPFR